MLAGGLWGNGASLPRRRAGQPFFQPAVGFAGSNALGNRSFGSLPSPSCSAPAWKCVWEDWGQQAGKRQMPYGPPRGWQRC